MRCFAAVAPMLPLYVRWLRVAGIMYSTVPCSRVVLHRALAGALMGCGLGGVPAAAAGPFWVSGLTPGGYCPAVRTAPQNTSTHRGPLGTARYPCMRCTHTFYPMRWKCSKRALSRSIHLALSALAFKTPGYSPPAAGAGEGGAGSRPPAFACGQGRALVGLVPQMTAVQWPPYMHRTVLLE